VQYDGEVYNGEHEGIIDEKTWNLVQKFIKANDPGWDRSKRRASDAALHGIIRCGHCNCAMTPIQSKRWGKVYRYYRCAKDANRDVPICPVKEVSAGDIEKLVCEQIDPILKSPEVVAGVAQETGLRPKTITSLLGEGFWEELTPLEKQRLMQILLERVVINEDGIIIEIRTESIKSIQEVYLEQDS
jgi:site-specific DNA recombinase